MLLILYSNLQEMSDGLKTVVRQSLQSDIVSAGHLGCFFTPWMQLKTQVSGKEASAVSGSRHGRGQGV